MHRFATQFCGVSAMDHQSVRLMMDQALPRGSDLLSALPDDVFAIISRFLSPRDICSLSLSCRSLNALAATDKVWFVQCEALGLVAARELSEWREGVISYKALCRFLVGVRPLIGIWVHQNPELGNVVYVMPGFISVVGCRIIPQELGPLGLEDGPLLWAPVFEIIGDCDGSMAFFLHGREKDGDYFYPGSLKPIHRTCNVLLLEVEPQMQNSERRLSHSKSLVHLHSDRELSRRISMSDNGISRSQRMTEPNESIPFSQLAFGDRRKLLEIVTNVVRLKVPDSAIGPLFPRSSDDYKKFQRDMVLLSERRMLLLQMHRLGVGHFDWEAAPGLQSDPTQMDLSKIKKSLDRSSGCHGSLNGEESHSQRRRSKTVAGYFRDGLKQILGRSNSVNGSRSSSKNGTSSSGKKHAQLHEFLMSGDTLGLNLHASTMKLTTYRAWPNMPDNRFALYKLPTRAPAAGEEYAGLWGGTFGWPPGRSSEDKPGKALFLLLLSYEETEGQRLLIATKILEGTHYVLHPNGSAMFVVKVDEPLQDPFPWDNDGNSFPVDMLHAYNGEGIANGYGFRYPGSKPGSLFVIQNGLLAFIWKETRVVLTLQRLDLQQLLRKGEQVPALPPIANFSYLTKSYSNVFAGGLSSPRQQYS
ncbi:PREDICTED: F-box protein At5g39450 isoform X2 [Nelumbo nucifera]|nr:PREDICTED: F-box protein At5g39450 isoform X2 [Nelumbo nucifera]XP_010269075.1 PREDICTED: F-box protein At5g39450 isoform X2 [Nelumbo nucifera]